MGCREPNEVKDRLGDALGAKCRVLRHAREHGEPGRALQQQRRRERLGAMSASPAREKFLWLSEHLGGSTARSTEHGDLVKSGAA